MRQYSQLATVIPERINGEGRVNGDGGIGIA